MRRNESWSTKNSSPALRTVQVIFALIVSLAGPMAYADWPAPFLNSVFPAGGRAGTVVTVSVQGATLEGLTALRFAEGSGLTAEKTGDNQFAVAIADDTPPGSYDVCAVGEYGISAPRPFVVGRLNEFTEIEPNNDRDTAMAVALDTTVNGKINPHGDVDVYSFAASAGQRVVVECFAERIDSQLHGVLELYDAAGKKLASSRGYTGVDPLVDVVIPADGVYTAKLFDLTFTGGETRFYRLDIDTKPRVAFAFPPVIERGQPADVVLFGRNLHIDTDTTVAVNDVVALENGTTAPQAENPVALRRTVEFDQLATTISASDLSPRVAFRSAPKQLAAGSMAYYHRGGHAPVAIAVADVPVIIESDDNHSPDRAQRVDFPCEIAGRLTRGSEHDWYAVDVERGDVLYIEAFGERIGSPVDLDLAVLDASGTNELLHLGDETDHQQKPGYPANHFDPAGRWVAPAAGRYLIIVRNLIGGGSRDDERRIYRLSLRREEPAFAVVAAARSQERMSGLTLRRGQREMLDVVVERRRGEVGPMHITAENLPPGVECPSIWIGPGAERAPLIVSSTRDASPSTGRLDLVAENELGERVAVRGMMLVQPGQRIPERRLTDDIALATIAAECPVSLTATMEPVGFEGEIETVNGDPVVYQGAVIDVLLTAERRLVEPAAVSLKAVGLPGAVENQFATIAADERQAWLSFYLPMNLPPGPYTIAVAGTTEIPTASITPGKDGKTSVPVFSNPLSFYVDEARIDVEIDRFAPTKIARGQTLTVDYSAKGLHGFIGKIHTELVAPGGVVGIRGRGVTFVNGTETGTIQIIATENAALGKLPFLRLDSVGTVEDRQVYRGAEFLDLEITE